MIGRRIFYGLILIAALLFQITNDNYLAPVLLALCLALPVLSLLISLPVILSCRLTLHGEAAGVSRGTEAQWSMIPKLPIRLPLPRLKVVAVEKNLLTGATAQHKLALTGVTRQMQAILPVSTSHCGLLELRVKKVRAYDLMGLFAIPLPKPEPARIPVEPIPRDPGPLHIPEGWGMRPAPGSAPKRSYGEDYELREYRPGDPMRTVHWKLSSKWDDLIVRDPAETVTPLVVLSFRWFGTPERLDAILDKLAGYSKALLAVQRPHALQWISRSEEPSLHPVSDEKDLQDGLLALLSSPAPAQAPASDPDRLTKSDGAALRIHLTPDEEVDE